MTSRSDPEIDFGFIQPNSAVLEEQFGANEIDFDDERDDDQLPLDREEASELGVLLDDPESLEL